MGFLDFDFGAAVETAAETAVEFIKDIELEDLATIATTGIAISQFLDKPEPITSPLATVKTAASALQEGALITAATAAPTIDLGADEELTETNRAATRRNLRVRRDTSQIGAGTGLVANPLGIRI